MAPESTGQTQERRSAVIMMVDDEPTTLEVIGAFLESEGYENLIAIEDSRKAITAAARRRPDVLLLDLMMPHVSGLEILRTLRADPVLGHTPVLILTSSTDPAIKLKALELGATDFLAKPVDASELALRLRNTLTVKAYQDRLAYFDSVTGLPNRRRFAEELAEFTERLRVDPADGALLHLSLARFQQVHDGLGQQASDDLVKAVAARLRECVSRDGGGVAGEKRILARAALADFLIFVEGAGSAGRAAGIARTILSRLGEPYRVAGRDFVLPGVIGITLFPDDSEGVDTLLGNASAAMSHAKRRSRNGYEFHDESLNADLRERLAIESELQRALERGEIALHYQPKVNVETNRIEGAEALMRWTNPRLGSIPPTRFINIAEESDLIVRLGDWAIRTVCWQIRAWQQAGFPEMRVAVNVSGRQFRSGNLLRTVETALVGNHVEGRFLVIELTESMIMENPAETARILGALKRLGVTISVDDFGTGFSSLSALKRFPIDELKIDRSFVKGIPDDPDDCAIVAAVIAMGHALGLTLVAEGAETEEQIDFLRERGCQLYQGYRCSVPLGAADWPMLLARLG